MDPDVRQIEEWSEQQLGLLGAAWSLVKEQQRRELHGVPPLPSTTSTMPDTHAVLMAAGHHGIAAGLISELGPVSTAVLTMRTLGQLSDALAGRRSAGGVVLDILQSPPLHLEQAHAGDRGAGWSPASDDDDLELDISLFPHSYLVILRTWWKRLVSAAPSDWVATWSDPYLRDASRETLRNRRWHAFALVQLYVRLIDGLLALDDFPATPRGTPSSVARTTRSSPASTSAHRATISDEPCTRHRPSPRHPRKACGRPDLHSKFPRREVRTMKFIVQWTNRYGNEPDDNVEAGESLIKAFSSWSPPDAVTISEFVTRADGGGGLLICETDDLSGINTMVAQYIAWLDYDVIPVIDVADGVGTFADGLSWAKQSID